MTSMLRDIRFPLISTLLFLLSWNLLLIDISSPEYRYFDEVRYVSAANQLILGGVNENWSHPPLAKSLIGLGIRMFGDNPLGWRFMSSIFGSLIIVAMFVWGLIFFRSFFDAAIVGLLTLFNQIHFIHARTAMLDVFMVGFIVLGLIAFTVIWISGVGISPRLRKGLFFLCGTSLGLALSCKWAALLAAIFCFVLYLAKRDSQSWRRRLLLAMLGFVILPLVTYFLVCSLLLGKIHPEYAPPLSWNSPKIEMTAGRYSLQDLIPLQLDMIKAQMSYQDWGHPGASSWWTWPLMLRPLWYDIRTRAPDGKMAGVLCVGNPMIFWVGVIAVILCGFFWYSRCSQSAAFITLLFGSLWLTWSIVPRGGGYIYYYYPAAMVLSLAIVYAAIELKISVRWRIFYVLLCGASFAFFYPLLTGRFLSLEAFQLRLLFRSWM